MNSTTTGKLNNGKVLPKFNKLITELIGIRMGVRPEQVTTEFLHLWRERELYPTAPVEVIKNGYLVLARRALSPKEVDAQSSRARAFFGELSQSYS